MAGSVNKVIILGNLGRDPEVRTSNDGNKIVQLNIATSERWKDRNSGEQKEKTEWHRVVIFNENLSNIAEQYLKNSVNDHFIDVIAVWIKYINVMDIIKVTRLYLNLFYS